MGGRVMPVSDMPQDFFREDVHTWTVTDDALSPLRARKFTLILKI